MSVRTASFDFRLRLLMQAGCNATRADEFVDWAEHQYPLSYQYEKTADPTAMWNAFVASGH